MEGTPVWVAMAAMVQMAMNCIQMAGMAGMVVTPA